VGTRGEPMDGRIDASYLTTGQAAARLGISKSTLYRTIRHGVIKPYYRTPGGYQRFRPSDIEAYARLLVAHGVLQGIDE